MQGDFPREWKIDLSGVFPGIWRRGKGVLFIGWIGWQTGMGNLFFTRWVYERAEVFHEPLLCSVVSMPVQPVLSQWHQENTSSWKNKIISFSFTIGEIPHSVGHSSFFFLLVAMLYTFSCAINLFVSFMFSCHFGYIIIYYNYYNYKFEFCNY